MSKRSVENAAVTEILAIETGFGDEQTLRRSLLRRFGIGPAQYRCRFSGHSGSDSKPTLADLLLSRREE